MTIRDAEEKIQQMSITERITKLSETATSQVNEQIEKALVEEQQILGSTKPETGKLVVEHGNAE